MNRRIDRTNLYIEDVIGTTGVRYLMNFNGDSYFDLTAHIADIPLVGTEIVVLGDCPPEVTSKVELNKKLYIDADYAIEKQAEDIARSILDYFAIADKIGNGYATTNSCNDIFTYKVPVFNFDRVVNAIIEVIKA